MKDHRLDNVPKLLNRVFEEDTPVLSTWSKVCKEGEEDEGVIPEENVDPGIWMVNISKKISIGGTAFLITVSVAAESGDAYIVAKKDDVVVASNSLPENVEVALKEIKEGLENGQ